MKKRGNENSQLRPDEVEALNDESDEEQGTYQRASAEEMATRKIVKVRRPGATTEAPKPVVATPAAAPNANPFANFSGLTNKTPAPAANPFANFTGLVSAPVPAPAAASSAPVVKPFTFAPSTIAAPAAPVSATPSIPSFSFPSAPATTITKTTGTTATAFDNGDESEHKKKLKKLNNSFLQWTARQIENHPLSSWKDGVKDYIKYANDLTVKYPENGDKALPDNVVPKATPIISFATTSAPVTKAPEVKPFEFPAAPAAAKVESKVTPAPPVAKTNDLLFFGGPQVNSFTTAAPFAPNPFGPKTTAPAAPAATTTPAFGGFASTNFQFPSIPSFGAPAASIGGSTTAAGEDDEGGDDEGEPILEPEKVLRNENDTDDILVDVPCKLFGFDKTSKEWKDTGKGTFRITKNVDNNKQRMLIRNPIGKITFNAGFYKQMKIEKVKGGLTFSAFVAPDDAVVGGGSAAPSPPELKKFMIKLKETDITLVQDKLEAAIALC